MKKRGGGNLVQKINLDGIGGQNVFFEKNVLFLSDHHQSFGSFVIRKKVIKGDWARGLDSLCVFSTLSSLI